MPVIRITVKLKILIKSFADADTQELFETGRSRRFRAIEKVASRKLLQLDEANVLDFMKVPPRNKLHALDRDRAGQHAVWINDQYRICFTWKENERPAGSDLKQPVESHAYDVEVTDYH